jgi:gluconokinase
MASATGIFNFRECSWDEQLVRFLKIKRANLPRIADSAFSSRLNASFAKRWPRLAHARWFPAIGDGAANNIGSGCNTDQRAALMIGTSGAMRVAYRGEPPKKIPAGLWCYRIDRERVIVGGALSDGGGLYEWLKENLRLPQNADRFLAKRPPALHGLTFLPFLDGERSTGYHERAAGSIIGLTSSMNAVDIVRAAMEGVGYRFAEIFDQICEVADVREIIASGGALRASGVWTQILADILGRNLMLIGVPEASLRGAVLLAFETIGNIEGIEEISSGRGKVFEPNIDRHAAYSIARNRQRQLYDLIINYQ